MKNSPEDLAMFTAMTLDEPLLSLNYTSGDDLAYQTSFTGAAMAAGELPGRWTTRPTAPPPNVAAGGGGAAAPRPAGGAGRRAAARRRTTRSGATTRARAGAGRSTRSVMAPEELRLRLHGTPTGSSPSATSSARFTAPEPGGATVSG